MSNYNNLDGQIEERDEKIHLICNDHVIKLLQNSLQFNHS